jgi:hypothetical protein
MGFFLCFYHYFLGHLLYKLCPSTKSIKVSLVGFPFLNAMYHTCTLYYCITCAWKKHVLGYNIIYCFVLASNLIFNEWQKFSLQLCVMLVLQHCCKPCCDIVWHTYYCSGMVVLHWKNTNVPFSCLYQHWTLSFFYLEWMIAKEELKVQQLFSFCFFMVDCKRSFKSSCIV